jgi:hypothetical protein
MQAFGGRESYCMRSGTHGAHEPAIWRSFMSIRFPRYPLMSSIIHSRRSKNSKKKLQRPIEVEYYVPVGTERAGPSSLQAVVDAHHETTGKAVPAMFCPPFAYAIDANRQN